MNDAIEIMRALASLYKKKAAVMKALEGGIVKGGTNKHFDYKFMEASTIKHTVSALFAEHGISLQMSGVATENAVSHVEVKDYVTKETRLKEVPILRIQFAISLCDVDTGAVEQSFWFGEAGATDDKAANKCATAALKYYLISNLLIADKSEDARDTDRDGGRKRKESPPQERKQTAPSLPMTTGEAIKQVLSGYQPFMDSANFERMKAGLRSDVQAKTFSWTSPQDARVYIERAYGTEIDLDALRMARKELQP